MDNLEGSIQYWDGQGNIHNPSLRPLPKIQQLQNRLRAFGSNAQDWVENEDINSKDYHQKLKLTELGLMLLSTLKPQAVPMFPKIEYYNNPIGNFNLPRLLDNSLSLVNKMDKNVLLKDNIVLKNRKHHPEVNINENNSILENSLYNPNYILKVKPQDKPNYYTFINSDNFDTAVLDMDSTKPDYEVVNWFRTDAKRLNGYKNRTNAEGGDFLITNQPIGAAHLSALNKGSNNIINDNTKNFNPSLFERLIGLFKKNN